MTPDSSGRGLPELRVRLADRSLLQTNPLLAVADLLLELAGGRVTASQVLDLASTGAGPAPVPVRRGRSWPSSSDGWPRPGVRWGLDGDHRASGVCPVSTANTWSAGLDRLLLGVAMAEDDQRLFAGTLPLDDVVSGRSIWPVTLAELVDRLGAAVGRAVPTPVDPELAGRHRGRHGLARRGRPVRRLAARPALPGPRRGRRRGRPAARRRRAGPRPPPDSAGSRRGPRAACRDACKGRPTRANFRTGDLTVCTLVPMRSVPHRVVGLLGLDDGVFPRHTERDGDDLFRRSPRSATGCPERGSPAAARRRAGRDGPPGDHVQRSRRAHQSRAAAGRAHRRATRRGGPDRPRARANGRGAPGTSWSGTRCSRSTHATSWPGPMADGPRSFDPVSLEGAMALCARRRPRRPFLTGCLPPMGGEVVQLESLIRFVEHPVKAFLRERLGWYARTASTRSTMRCPSSWTPWRNGRWGTGC